MTPADLCLSRIREAVAEFEDTPFGWVRIKSALREYDEARRPMTGMETVPRGWSTMEDLARAAHEQPYARFQVKGWDTYEGRPVVGPPTLWTDAPNRND